MSEKELKTKVQGFINKRSAVKRKITGCFANIEDDPSTSNISAGTEIISDALKQVDSFNEHINEVYNSLCPDDEELEEGEAFSPAYNAELDKQTQYSMATKKRLAELNSKKDSTQAQGKETRDCRMKLPELNIDCFSGEGSSNLEFHSFITKFNNVVGLRSNLNDSTKLTYLKTYLKGYAYKLVAHLQINDDNYVLAVNLLEREFLNKEALVDDLFTKLCELKPDNDKDYIKTKIFINDVKCILSDLKVYECDLLESNASLLFLSHIIFNKLNFSFRQELVRRINCNYPDLNQIFDNYVDVVKTLNLKQSRTYDKSPNVKTDQILPKPVDKYAYETPPIQQHAISSESSNSKYDPKLRNCKFCSATSHSMFNCRKYPSHDARMKRCKELGLCMNCSSSKHRRNACKTLDFSCSICGSNNHIGALCTKYVNKVSTNSCINSSSGASNDNVLPTAIVNICSGNNKTSLRCLIDTGSQRSYIAQDVLKRLKCHGNAKSDFLINTFVEKSYKKLSQMSLLFNLEGDKPSTLPFLIDEKFALSFNVRGLKDAHYNIGRQYNLAEQIKTDDVLVEGLLGTDAIQYFSTFSKLHCIGGSAFQLPGGIVPFGNVDNFLYSKQLNCKYGSSGVGDEFPAKNSHVVETSVNFVLEPAKSYFDPIDSVISDSMVEGKLENMFDVESLGILESTSSYDEQKIKEFNDGISFESGSYHVELPWHEKVSEVKSNFEVSKSILNKVVEKLNSNDLYDKYDAVLQQQLNDEILEPIDLNTVNTEDHVWIPHRPVIKTEDQVTTKLRIVLNCSLKIGKTPSLNEAAYPGVNLLNDLLKLLIKVRQDDFLVLSDIKSAFLMIKLKRESDRNRFSILWKDREGKLVGFRYKTIVFGFVSSPFMLNYIIKHHISQFDMDDCYEILNSNIYVDNVFFTGNDEQTLLSMYNECLQRLSSGGFFLRSWASNSNELKDKFLVDKSNSTHGSCIEKLLGYEFNTSNDTIKIASSSDVSENKVTTPITKRFVLSLLSKYFDPIGLVLPVTVGGKILLREIWASKTDWDVEISENLKSDWRKIEGDLVRLQNLEFPRKAFNDDLSLIVFCDASKSAYGFCCYARYKVNSKFETNLLFAKCKSAPLKTKTLPTLELLSVFLAFKCLPTIIETMKNLIKDIYINVDAQVVLSWLMSEKIKAKNVFAANRLKDICSYTKDIKDEYGLKCHYKYVPTEKNPADMLTRGISYKEFSSKFQFWIHGPEYISQDRISWPDRNLNCLNEENKKLVCNVNNVCVETTKTVLNIEDYSSFDKLLRATAKVMKFVNKMKRVNKTDLELYNDAKVYWIKHEQSKYFLEELNYLNSDDKSAKVPSRVSNLNLFVDEHGLLKCRSRLLKCSFFDDDILEPIVLPQLSYLTGLVIRCFHEKCKHMGTGTTLTCVRKEGFWIPHGRTVIRKLLSKCIVCKKINSNHFKYPKPSCLPADRVNFTKPFRNTGVDFTGHLFVKFGTEIVKMYVIVFTCLNVRAVHLELVPSMSSKHFLQAFLRFSNIYNMPVNLYSDNASQFINAMNYLQGGSVDNEFNDYLTKNNIKHVKIPLYAAWVGSTWERLIRTIKMCLHKTVGRKRLEYFDLFTLLSDITNSINSRPLTYRDNSDVNLQMITPNSFLKFETGSRVLLDHAAGSQLLGSTRDDIVRSLEKREELTDTFRDLWHEQYLLFLKESNKNYPNTDWENKVKINDIVLISAHGKTRPFYQMGRILKVLPGNDGIIRFVEVFRPDRSKGVYPISHLYPLEISASASEDTALDNVAEAPRLRPPKRKAAIKCMESLKCN